MSLLVQILVLLGTVGLFLYGMKTMSEALQKIAGNRLRSVLSSMTASPGRGVVAGTLITGLVQSSSAVTVMIVGFVNAGLLSLTQSIAMIMGANIGTTVTAWLVSVLGYNLDIGLTALPLIGLAFPLLFFRRNNLRAVGSALIGFALMMLAISMLNGTMGSLTDNPETMRLIGTSREFGAFAPLLFVLIGAVLTALLQSSSATITLTIVLVVNGLIPLNCAMAMVLGENIGTTLTANLAAVMTNAVSRRAALFHFLFNLFGAVWGLLTLPLLMGSVVWVIVLLGGVSPLNAATSQPIALALFHTLFNVTNTLILVWFIPRIARLMERLVRSRKPHTSVQSFNPQLLAMSEMSVYQVQKELHRYARDSSEVFGLVWNYFRETNQERAAVTYQEIERSCVNSRRAKAGLDLFLFKIAEEEIGDDGRLIVQKLFLLTADVAAVFESYYNISQVICRKRNKNIWFSPQMRDQATEIFNLVRRLQQFTVAGLSGSPQTAKAKAETVQLQSELSGILARFQEDNLNEPDVEDVKYSAGVIFSELVVCFGQLSTCIVKINEDRA